MEYGKAISIILLCISGIWACGPVLHNAIAHRALRWLNYESFHQYHHYISNHPGSYQAGVAFPDWGYACGYSMQSERAHEKHFQRVFAEYFREQSFQQPFDDRAEKLIAFYLGLVSHQVSDIVWHNLFPVNRTKLGFIHQLSRVDFGNNFAKAHRIADMGGEFISAYDMDLSFVTDHWEVPIKDITAIYSKMGLEVLPEKLLKCMSLMLLEVMVIKEFGSYYYSWAAFHSPHLVDQMVDYFFGGVDDSALWTSICWRHSIDLLGAENKTNHCFVQSESPNVQAIEGDVNVALSNLKNAALRLLDLALLTVESDDSTQFVFVTLKSIANQLSPLIHWWLKEPSISDHDFSVCGPHNSPLTYEGSAPYGYFGRSIAAGDLNNDGIDDIVIGSPGFGEGASPSHGAIFVKYGSKEPIREQLIIDSVSADIFIDLKNNTGARFGDAVLVIDFNADGYQDIVVSAPTRLMNHMYYSGLVLIFLGLPEGGISDRNVILINPSYFYTNLGSVLYKYDFDGDGFDDLVIGSPLAFGSPQMGNIAIFLSHSRRIPGHLSLSQADESIRGYDRFSYFGASMVGAKLSDGRHVLFVGAPKTSHSKRHKAWGKVYGFDINMFFKNTSDVQPIVILNGYKDEEQFGFSLGFGHYRNCADGLVVSSPTLKNVDGQNFQRGEVNIFNITGVVGNVSRKSLQHLLRINGDQNGARFGWAVKLINGRQKTENVVWISQPLRNSNDGNNEGALFGWKEGGPKKVENPAESASFCFLHKQKQSKFGFAIEVLDFNGDGILDIASSAPYHGESDLGQVLVFLGGA